jgi:splicing factor 3A subunit 2
MKNHLGTYECKLCMTLHTTEGNYLAHTQGKKHTAGLARRAALDARNAPSLPLPLPGGQYGGGGSKQGEERRTVKIGRPGYSVSKSIESGSDQKCITFTIDYSQALEGTQPRHRFMSAFEQRKESPDKDFQFLLFACEPYETIGFKIPNKQIDKGEGRFVSNWVKAEKKFMLTLFFEKEEDADAILAEQ